MRPLSSTAPGLCVPSLTRALIDWADTAPLVEDWEALCIACRRPVFLHDHAVLGDSDHPDDFAYLVRLCPADQQAS